MKRKCNIVLCCSDCDNLELSRVPSTNFSLSVLILDKLIGVVSSGVCVDHHLNSLIVLFFSFAHSAGAFFCRYFGFLNFCFTLKYQLSIHIFIQQLQIFQQIFFHFYKFYVFNKYDNTLLLFSVVVADWQYTMVFLAFDSEL